MGLPGLEACGKAEPKLRRPGSKLRLRPEGGKERGDREFGDELGGDGRRKIGAERAGELPPEAAPAGEAGRAKFGRLRGAGRAVCERAGPGLGRANTPRLLPSTDCFTRFRMAETSGRERDAATLPPGPFPRGPRPIASEWPSVASIAMPHNQIATVRPNRKGLGKSEDAVKRNEGNRMAFSPA